jgi:type III secretory pathway component EscV
VENNNKQFILPPFSDLLFLYLLFFTIATLVLPTSVFFLDIIVVLNWVFSITVLTISPYVQNVSSFSALPVLIFCSSFNRMILGIKFGQLVLQHKLSMGSDAENFVKAMQIGILQFVDVHNYLDAALFSISMIMLAFVLCLACY